jgi:competence ComEA-like helix-hairpin-helix protein
MSILNHVRTQVPWSERNWKSMEATFARRSEVTDEQAGLKRKLSPANLGPLIYINTAFAEALRDGLAIPPQEASVLVKYRQENGNFKNLVDLLKARGVDANKIQEQRGNIVFDSKTP